MKNYLPFKILISITIGVLSSLNSSSQFARVQVIHNSADAAADSVDVYLNGALLLDNFAFRTATPFINAPAGVNIRLAIAGKNSTSEADSITGAVFNYNLTQDSTYIIVADGIVSATGYTPNPAFDLKVYLGAREQANTTGNTDVLVHHGSTDAPTVDVDERTAGNLVNDASYGQFAGYLELATNDYILDVKDQTGTTTVASFQAPLTTLGLVDSALVVVASGFLDPANNSNGAAFGLWVALPSGGALIQLPTAQPVSITENEITILRTYPNPAQDFVNFEGENLEGKRLQIIAMDGRTINTNMISISGNKMNISNLAKGIYTVKVIGQNQTVALAKIIKM